MASVNKVILIGNVGNDPKIYQPTSTATKVASLSLATTERGYTRRDGTKVEDRTEWHTLTVFGNLVSVVENYVHKGSQIYVEGRLQTSSYTDTTGVERFSTKVIVDAIQLLDKKNAAGQQQPQQQQQQPRVMIDVTPPPRAKNLSQQLTSPNGFAAVDGDLPF